MAEVKTARDTLSKRLKETLLEGLKRQGVTARVETETVPTTRYVRALVTAKQFENMYSSERQEVVWNLVNRAFTRDEQLRISIILTSTPEELGEEE